jgi:rhodanese-related sulfurtransferase
VEALKAQLDRGDRPFILDVRNPNEYQICFISGSTLLPLPELAARVSEVPRDREVIVHCKSGMRSAKAMQFLREQGYTNIKDLTGGIAAWAERIDPAMPKY